MELMLVEVCQGKEAIHHIDPTRYAPFISLNRVAIERRRPPMVNDPDANRGSF